MKFIIKVGCSYDEKSINVSDYVNKTHDKPKENIFQRDHEFEKI